MADEVLAFPGYKFFCHQKMKEELKDHGTQAAQAWLEAKIASGEIVCCSDTQIITALREQAGESCYHYYMSYLKQGCALFDAGFYAKYFQPLDEWIFNPLQRQFKNRKILSQRIRLPNTVYPFRKGSCKSWLIRFIIFISRVCQ